MIGSRLPGRRRFIRAKAGAVLSRSVLSGLERACDNLLTLGMVTIITVAIGENVSAILWR